MARSLLCFCFCIVSVFAATPRTARNAKAPINDRTERAWALRTLKAYSLRELAAQLLVIPFYGDYPNSHTSEYRQFEHLVRDTKVGGLIILNRTVRGSLKNAEPYEMAAFLNRMQSLAKTPLLVAGDFERGASMRVAATTKYPHNMAFGAAGDLALSRYEGAATAREARALGVHWIMAPDADVNNNPDNPIINIRSYSEDPAQVAAHVKAYLEGAQSDPKQRVLTTVKHFPGHGDTNVDSHIGLGSVTGDRARLDAVELMPFRAAIAAGVDTIMTAHLTVPALEPNPIPATVSPAVLTKLLRDDLQFKGIVVTDAMDMQGLSQQFPPGEAAVRAIEAGADVLLIPPKPEEAVSAVVAAVRSGRLTRARIEQSVGRLLQAKVRLGLVHNRFVELQTINDNIDSPEASDRAQEAADRALTLVKNENNLLPLAHPENSCTYLLIESRYGQQGRVLREELQRRAPGVKITFADPSTIQAEVDQAVQNSKGCAVNVIAAFVTVGAYRGNVALNGALPSLVNGLLGTGTPAVMVSLGNPYLLRSFPAVSAYVATYSTAPTSEIAAAKAIAGQVGFAGKLPVTIPGQAKFGDGIQLSAPAPSAASGPRISGLDSH